MTALPAYHTISFIIHFNAGTMHAIVKRTSQCAKVGSEEGDTAEKANVVFSREMKLVQSQNDILHPPRLFRAQRVD